MTVSCQTPRVRMNWAEIELNPCNSKCFNVILEPVPTVFILRLCPVLLSLHGPARPLRIELDSFKWLRIFCCCPVLLSLSRLHTVSRSRPNTSQFTFLLNVHIQTDSH